MRSRVSIKHKKKIAGLNLSWCLFVVSVHSLPLPMWVFPMYYVKKRHAWTSHGRVKPVPAFIGGEKVGYTVDTSPVHHRPSHPMTAGLGSIPQAGMEDAFTLHVFV